MNLISEAELQQHKKTMLSLLDAVGEAQLRDTGSEDATRALEAETSAPLDPPFATAFFRYEEIYQRRGARWELVDYYYEFQQRPGPGRRAHHSHDGPHQHCVDPRAPGVDHHYVGGVMTLFDAHREFLYWYGAEQPVSCTGLTPLFG